MRNVDDDYNYSIFFNNDDREEEEFELRNFGRDDKFVCASIRKVIYPQLGTNMKDERKLIINQIEYVQGVVIEECAK